jgi:hypothetical protein
VRVGHAGDRTCHHARMSSIIGSARSTSAAARRGIAVAALIAGFATAGVLAPPFAAAKGAERRAATIPAAARALLLKDALRAAQENGDGHPYDIEAVRTTAREAARVLESGLILGSKGKLPVYIVALRGRFKCGGCSGPRGSGTPAGSVITLNLPVSAGEGLPTGFGLPVRYPRLKAAGAVVRL